MKRILPKTMSALALAMVSAPGAWAQTAPPKLGDAANAELDSVQNGLDKYESMARRSLVGGGSKPVSFAGEAIGKIVSSAYDKSPTWMDADKTQFKNSFVALRMAMVASPNRNLRLWSKIAFNHAMLGNHAASNLTGNGTESGTTVENGWNRSVSTGEAGFRMGSLVYEDMSAGLVAKIGPTTWSAKAGGVLWNELSPLTVWKTQPRIFAWDYLPFELEQSTAQFYDYGTVKGEKSGRAAWNKKPFQGIQLESVELPYGMYFNGFYGIYEGYNKNQAWLVPMDKNTELHYTQGDAGYRSYSTKGFGISDQYRFSSFLRLAKTDLPNGLAAGANWFGYNIDKDYPKQWKWVPTNETQYLAVGNFNGKQQYVNNYYVEPKTASFDVRRTVPGGLNFHVDLALSKADTSFFRVDSTDEATLYRADMQAKAATTKPFNEVGKTSTNWVPGLYTTVGYPVLVADKQFDLELRTVYFPKKFQSVGSIVNPMDGIFPYEANMTGAGKFAGADNGTAYASNMAGTNLIVKAPVPRGHAKLSWGVHSQLENGNDLVYFPWRQNGAAYNATLASDFTQYDFGLLDDYITSPTANKRQARRLGDEFYMGPNGAKNPYAPQIGAAGGARGAFLSVYENFVGYKLGRAWKGAATRAKVSAEELPQWIADSTAFANDPGVKEVVENLANGTMPQSKKFTSNLSLDGAWEISQLWNGKRSVFLGGYLALNSVTKSNAIIPAFSADDDNVLLAGKNIRIEPVIQVTPKFYVIGLLGNETWKSSYGVAYLNDSASAPKNADWNPSKQPGLLVSAPIDYSDWIYGLGFDWDMASRVGLHVRCQYFTHEDKGISTERPKAAGINDYQAWLTSAEVKMWF